MKKFVEHKKSLANFPNENNFTNQTEQFFQQLAEQENDFRSISFPFNGSDLIDKQNWERIVKIAPEFILSIIDLGIDKLLQINSTETVPISQYDNISINDIVISSNTIKYLWSLSNSWIESQYQDFNVQAKLLQLSDCITNPEIHTDIRGCLQFILSEIKTRSLLPDKLTTYVNLLYPKEKSKRRLLLDLTRDYTKILNYFEFQPARTVINRTIDKLVRDINNEVLKNTDDVQIIGSNNQTKENIRRSTTFFKNGNNILFVGEHGTGRMHLIRYLLNETFARYEIYHCGASKDKNFDNLMLNLEKEPSIHNPGYIGQTWNGVLVFQDLEKATDFQIDKIYQLYQEKYSNPNISRRKLQFFGTITSKGFKNLDRNLKFICFNKKIFVPSLIEIEDDIPELAHHFFIQSVGNEHLLAGDINKETFDLLKKGKWNNNIAELKNFVEEIADEICFKDAEEPVESVISRLMIERKTSSDVRPFNTLKINLPKDPTDPKDKAHFQIGNNQNLIKPVELSHDQASLLLYLAMERQNGGTYWLEKPDEHRSELKRIFNCLYLANYFEDEIDIDTPNRQEKSSLKTWVWDFDNKRRKAIVSDINNKIKNLREIDFKIISGIPTRTASRKGNYAINKQIEYIVI